MAKITQFSVGMVDRVNPASNLLPATMTAQISMNAASLLSDIKPGYMLGGKPRHQVWGHVIGIVSGAIFSVPLFFLLFLRPNAVGRASTPRKIMSDKFPMPAAVQWRGVAEIIAKGFHGAPASAVMAAAIAAVVALLMEMRAHLHQGPLPAVGGVGGPGRGAAVRLVRGDVDRRDGLLDHGPHLPDAGHQGARRSGSRARSRSARA